MKIYRSRMKDKTKHFSLNDFTFKTEQKRPKKI